MAPGSRVPTSRWKAGSVIVGLDGASAVAFDLDHWGLWADGADEDAAVNELVSSAHEKFAAFVAAHGSNCGPVGEMTVLERQPAADEGAFSFERKPATDAERERTHELYRWARADLVTLVGEASDAELDWIDPTRRLADWAWWHSARQMAWHCAITESCYYLGRVGVTRPMAFADLSTPLPAPDTATLLELLAISQQHVETWIERLRPDVEVVANGEVWTTRKVLRRLAGHERAENGVTAELLRNARLALS